MKKNENVSTRPEIIAELLRIKKENGGICQPEKVVEAAAKISNPLHFCFVWDDTRAAHAYRLAQARRLLRVVVHLIPNGSSGAYEHVRVFTSLTPDRKQPFGGYRATVDVLSSENMRAQLIDDALMEMKAFKRKYSDIIELCDVFSAMSNAEQKLTSRRTLAAYK